MAFTDRKSTAYLINKALKEAKGYSFFQLVEYIHALNNYSLECVQDVSPRDEVIKFSSTGSIGFPASDITNAGINEREGKLQPWIETSFFGMHGSVSPLPGHFLDIVAWEFAQKEGIRYHFLDFFNHRLTTLLHRAWRKYRYFVRYQSSGSDRFSTHNFSLLGAYDKALRSDTLIHWSLLLKYSGIISSNHRSAVSVSRIIAHYFNLKSVEIKEWVLRNVQISAAQQSHLGVANFSLGQSLVAGSQVPTRMGKFIISIKNLTQKEFQGFLPNGKNYPILVELTEFLLKDQHAYDLELGLLPDEIPLFEISSKSKKPPYLGWSTVLGGQDQGHKNNMLITVNVRL
ncbi:MAG: type VI secretion system baseplate subunit TssG [Thiomicrorhabdus sp.]|nr:type VI secretion system baseplate subunit TssG [Thiomicrorhabdus sp.]